MNDQIEKIRQLTYFLFFSIGFNVLLLSMLIYWVIRDRPPTPYYELKPADQQEQQMPIAVDMSNVQLLRHFRTFSKEQLLAKLTNSQLVEDGYSQRDLALACLVQCHFFDLSRALPKELIQEKRRKLSYSKRQGGSALQIIVYPGLTDEHFQKLIHFGNTEKWPLTSRGLFWNIHQHVLNKEPLDQSLVDAFCLTPEFMSVEMLFTRSGVNVDRLDLIQFLGEGKWEFLWNFTEQQKASQDLSSAKRQQFLLNYIIDGHKGAAYLLLKTDFSFAARKLDDGTIIKILNLLLVKTSEAEKFTLTILKSPRSEEVLKAASHRMYEYTGQSPPEREQKKLLPLAQMAVPIPKKQVVLNPLPNKNPPFKTIRYYVVKEGDSLWKISKLYHVEAEEIKKLNQLKSDALKPGLTLRIPTKLKFDSNLD